YFFYLSTLRSPLISTLFPYTTLFRSIHDANGQSILVLPCKRDDDGQEVSSEQCQPDNRSAHFGPRQLEGKNPKDHSPDDHCNLRSEEHTSELQSLTNIVCRLLLEKKK